MHRSFLYSSCIRKHQYLQLQVQDYKSNTFWWQNVNSKFPKFPAQIFKMFIIKASFKIISYLPRFFVCYLVFFYSMSEATTFIFLSIQNSQNCFTNVNISLPGPDCLLTHDTVEVLSILNKTVKSCKSLQQSLNANKAANISK